MDFYYLKNEISVLGFITDIKYDYVLCHYYEHIITLYNLFLSRSLSPFLFNLFFSY